LHGFTQNSNDTNIPAAPVKKSQIPRHLSAAEQTDDGGGGGMTGVK
jgi:hypothetical protein